MATIPEHGDYARAMVDEHGDRKPIWRSFAGMALVGEHGDRKPRSRKYALFASFCYRIYR
jgi:hypothetical protein